MKIVKNYTTEYINNLLNNFLVAGSKKKDKEYLGIPKEFLIDFLIISGVMFFIMAIIIILSF